MRNFVILAVIIGLLAACASPARVPPVIPSTSTPPATQSLPTPHGPAEVGPTPLPTRTRWQFGEPLPYAIQSGDNLQTIAIHFNTTPDSIRQANPAITEGDEVILTPGQRIEIPANYAPLQGTPYHIIPDSEWVYGPGQATFSTKATIIEFQGFLSRYSEYADNRTQSSWDMIEEVARDYSVNPRLLLALLEYRSGALTQPGVSDFTFPLGHSDPLTNGVYKQLIWAAETMTTGYYGWRSGTLTQVTTTDGFVERFDFWQNSGTVALHVLFASLMNEADFKKAVSPEGFGATYIRLFGDPFKYEVTLYPAHEEQPKLELPFLPGRVWSYTGGPHAAWGSNTPWAALDLAPPAVGVGCGTSSEPVTAMAPGIVARSADAAVVLDLDGDGNEHTGWEIFYYHMSLLALPPVGKKVVTGDMLGHGSCDGGLATGTHVHVVRRFNGEWIPADGPLPFVMSGWTAHSEGVEYKGTLTYELPSLKIEACVCVTPQNALSR